MNLSLVKQKDRNKKQTITLHIMSNDIHLTYDGEVRGLGSIDGFARLDTNARIPSNAPDHMTGKVMSATVRSKSSSSHKHVHTLMESLPNVFDYVGQDGARACTSKCAVSIDGGATWCTITLPTGHMTMRDIGSKISKQCATWWTDARDPGFSIQEDPKTKRARLCIDNSKCKIMHGSSSLAINFGVSQMGELLGFRKPCKFIATRSRAQPCLYLASDDAQMNWFGDSIELVCEFAPERNARDTLCDEQQPLLINGSDCDDAREQTLLVHFEGVRRKCMTTVRRPILWTDVTIHIEFILEINESSTCTKFIRLP